MELKPKYVLPKTQMVINSLLSQVENSQIDFSHEEYSIQIRNKNLLTINWYEPELTDIEWSVEFMGVKSLKHVSISHDQRRRIKILFWRTNALHFFEGQLKVGEKTSSMRKKIVQSQQVIPLQIQSNDDILFISKDLFPQEKKGVFFIQTVNRQFYVLMATDEKKKLIDLNYSSKISRLLSSVTQFWSPMIDENEVQNTIVTNVLIRNLPPDQESFKSITLRDFELQIRFVNIPLKEGEKCKSETYQQYFVDLRETICKQIQTNSQPILIHSVLYRLNEMQVVSIYLLKSMNQTGQFFLVSVTLDFDKKQLKQVKQLRFFRQDLQAVSWEKFNDVNQPNYFIVKQEYTKQTILHKLSLRELQIVESIILQDEGRSILCSSQENNHLLLLCPYKIYQINFKEKGMIPEDSESAMEQEEIEIQRFSSVREMSSSVSVQKPILEKYFKQNNYQKNFQILNQLAEQLNKRITSRRLSTGNDQELKELLKCWTSVAFYQCILMYEQMNSKKVFNEHRSFKDIQIKNNRSDYNELKSIFTYLIQHYPEDLISIWNDFLNLYKQSEYFKDEKFRSVQNSILDQNLLHFVHKALQVAKNSDKECLKLIQASQDIFKIERAVYRKLAQKPQNIKELKEISVKTNNISLMEIIYFETDQMINVDEIRSSFNYLKQYKSRHLFESSVHDFVIEYIERTKTNKFKSEKSRNLLDILAIFPNDLDFIKKVFEEQGSDLDILIGLKQGQRKEIKDRISKVADRLKTNQNREKLLLTIQNL